jgi:hypothetical protein
VGEGVPNRTGGYRVPAPETAALIDWPKAFGTRFTVFVDTEEEFDWSAPFDRSARSTAHIAAMPAAHARFAANGVPLTYLVDHPIATSPRAVEVLRRLTEDGESAIGTQLHPWVNPPFDEEVNGFNSFTGNLAPALQEAKLVALTEAIKAAFGTQPLAYRAGRYGIGEGTLTLLARHGYRIDTSMRSAYDYSREAGADFTAVGNHAFRAGAMVEVPLTTVFTGWGRSGGPGLYRALGILPKGRGIAARLAMLSRVALTPEEMPLADAKEAVRVAVGQGLRLLTFSFHSPSIEPGHTPYVRDAADLAAFFAWWEAIFVLLNRLGVAPASLAEIICAADACSGGPASARGSFAGGL